MSSNKSTTELHRGLEERHITLMSLGAAIGVGLFLGSGKAIQLAGPGILLAYAFSGLVMFFIMRALGEMAIQKTGCRFIQQVCQRISGAAARFLDRMELLVSLDRDMYGGNNCCRCLYGVLVPGRPSLDLGTCRSCHHDHSEFPCCQSVWGTGVLVCPDQNCNHYLYDLYWPWNDCLRYREWRNRDRDP